MASSVLGCATLPGPCDIKTFGTGGARWSFIIEGLRVGMTFSAVASTPLPNQPYEQRLFFAPGTNDPYLQFVMIVAIEFGNIYEIVFVAT